VKLQRLRVQHAAVCHVACHSIGWCCKHRRRCTCQNGNVAQPSSGVSTVSTHESTCVRSFTDLLSVFDRLQLNCFHPILRVNQGQRQGTAVSIPRPSAFHGRQHSTAVSIPRPSAFHGRQHCTPSAFHSRQHFTASALHAVSISQSSALHAVSISRPLACHGHQQVHSRQHWTAVSIGRPSALDGRQHWTAVSIASASSRRQQLRNATAVRIFGVAILVH
jgi:hypothetical protein